MWPFKSKEQKTLQRFKQTAHKLHAVLANPSVAQWQCAVLNDDYLVKQETFVSAYKWAMDNGFRLAASALKQLEADFTPAQRQCISACIAKKTADGHQPSDSDIAVCISECTGE